MGPANIPWHLVHFQWSDHPASQSDLYSRGQTDWLAGWWDRTAVAGRPLYKAADDWWLQHASFVWLRGCAASGVPSTSTTAAPPCACVKLWTSWQLQATSNKSYQSSVVLSLKQSYKTRAPQWPQNVGFWSFTPFLPRGTPVVKIWGWLCETPGLGTSGVASLVTSRSICDFNWLET